MRISPISYNNINGTINNKNHNQSINKNDLEFSKDYAESIKSQILSFVSFSGKSVPVYKIDKDLNCTYYEKQSELTKELGESPQAISACLSGRRSNIDGIVLAYPNEITTKLKDGSVGISKKKVAELYNRRLNPNSVYAVDYKGDFSYFHKKSDIDSKRGFVIVRASEVESFDDNGEKVIDRKKLSETLIQHPQYSAVYGFDRQSNFVKYRNQADYAEKNGVTTTAVSNAVVKQNRTVNGEYVIPAKEIEKVLDDGTIAIDDEKLIDYFSKKYHPSPTRRYTVTENLQLTKYETIKELTACTGMNYDTFVRMPNRLTPNGEYIIPASEIEEIGLNGQFVVNQTKLSRALWERTSQDSIYTIDINGKMEKHKDVKQAAQALNRAEQTLYSVLYEDGIHQAVAGKVVVRACDIESMDENGNIIIDRRKVTELIQKKLCPSAVYLVDQNGRCKKYKNRFVMANELGVPHSRGNLRINGFAIVDAKYIEEINDDGFITLNPDKVAFYAKHSKASF